MAIVKGKTIVMILAAILLFWLYLNPAILVRTIHLSRHDAWYGPIRFFYDHGLWLSLGPLLGAAISLFLAWSWWSISYFEVDRDYLKYQLGPFMENRIPIRAIQDIRMSRPMMGMMFDYGTLIVDAGRQEESLFYVPGVSRFVNMLGPSSNGSEFR